MRKPLTLGLILGASMAFGSLAIAGPAAPAGHGGPDHMRHGHEHGQRHGMNYDKLNLTDAQRTGIKQAMHDSFAQEKGQRQTLRDQRKAFESMTPDQVGYQAAASRLAQAEGDATRVRVQQKANLRAKIYALLTPAQKAQMLTMRTQKDARKEQWKAFQASHPAPAATVAPAAH